MKLSSKITLPMDPIYRPEIGITPVLDVELISRYQKLIGILRWVSEIGCFDILHEVFELLYYNTELREDHLHTVCIIFAYLKRYPNIRIDSGDIEIKQD